MDADELPAFQLTELVDELARSSDEEGLDDEGLTPNTKMVRDVAGDPDVVKITPQPAPAKRDEGGPSSDRSAGERIASAFWRCAHEAGFTMLCEALTFTGAADASTDGARPHDHGADERGMGQDGRVGAQGSAARAPASPRAHVRGRLHAAGPPFQELRVRGRGSDPRSVR